MTAVPFGRLRRQIKNQPPGSPPRYRYQFVDCRWELGTPGRGRELYLAGHIPGASFLDVDEDLAAPPGERGRHPLPEAADFAAWLGRLREGEEQIEPAVFEPRPRDGDTVTANELASRLDELVAVDARFPERYRGEPNPIDKVPGRVPGAVNAP